MSAPTGRSGIEGGAVTLRAERLTIDVDALVQRVRRQLEERAQRAKESAQRAAAQIERPAIGVAGVASRDELQAAATLDIGGLALKEVLEHADSGRATVKIPLLPQTLRAGPLSLAVEQGMALILEVVVLPGGVIAREETRGRLEPALKLPLGASVTGVSLDDSGAVIANLSGFPCYGHGHLTIADVVDIALGSIRQAAYDVRDISGRCRLAADIQLDGSRVSLALDELDVDVAHAHAGLATSEVSLAALHVGGASVHVERGAGPTWLAACSTARSISKSAPRACRSA